MNPVVRTLWVRALTDGSYRQATAVLRQNKWFGRDRFCVNGVLCDLFHKETGRGEWQKRPYGSRWFTAEPNSYRDDIYVIPTAVLEWAALTPDQARILAHRNDKGTTFMDLALEISLIPTTVPALTTTPRNRIVYSPAPAKNIKRRDHTAF